MHLSKLAGSIHLCKKAEDNENDQTIKPETNQSPLRIATSIWAISNQVLLPAQYY